MMSALTYFGASLFCLVVLTILFRVEDSYGDRLLLGRVRASLDGLTRRVWVWWTGAFQLSSGGGRARLIWHYFLHGLLKRLVRFAHAIAHFFERLLRRNRAAAKEIQVQYSDPHMAEIAAHKEKTALTEKQKKKLREG